MKAVASEAALSKASASPSLFFLLPVSLLVMLNLPLLFAINTGVDQYSYFAYFAIDALPNWASPPVLAFLTNCFLTALAFGCHFMLWRWQYRSTEGLSRPFRRAALVVGVPVLLAFMPSSLLTSNEGQAFPVMVGFLMFASMTITMALRDPATKLSPQDASKWLNSAIAVIVVLLIMSLGGMLYLASQEPLPPARNLFGDLELDWDRVNYGPEEFPRRHLEMLIPFTILGCAYMIFIVGGAMVGAIWDRRKPDGVFDNPMQTGPDPDTTVKDSVELESEETGEQPPQISGPADATTRQPDRAETPEQNMEGPLSAEYETNGGPSSEDGADKKPSPTLQEVWEEICRYDAGPNSLYVVSLNGEEVGVSEQDYEVIEQKSYSVYGEVDLFADMVLEEVYLGGEPVTFNAGSTRYYLMCIYAGKQPGFFHRNRSLRGEIVAYLGYDPGDSLNPPGVISYLIKTTFKDHPIVVRKSPRSGYSKVIEGRNVFLIKKRNNG